MKTLLNMPLVHKFSDYRNATKPEVILLLESFVRCSIARCSIARCPIARCSKTPLGFTLLELLVVIAILSILAAIAIPSFLRQTNRAREAEAKTYVGAINRAQQSYFTENWKFGSLADLEMGISNSNNYSYDSNPSISVAGSAALTTATPTSGARGYAGKVWLSPGISGDVTSYTLLCEGIDNSTPTISGTTCPN